jgi:hypothetical protein
LEKNCSLPTKQQFLLRKAANSVIDSLPFIGGVAVGNFSSGYNVGVNEHAIYPQDHVTCRFLIGDYVPQARGILFAITSSASCR